MKKQYRQGDVLIEEVKDIPNGVKEKSGKFGYLLVLGEGRNHGHVLAADKAEVIKSTDSITEYYLRIWNGTNAEINHIDINTGEKAEHTSINLPEGLYRVIRQREYNPYEKVIEKVRD